MRNCWPSLLLFLSVTSVLASSRSFENTAIVRTIELGGSIAHVTTTYAIKALEDGLKTYTVILGRDEKAKTSWLQAMVKGQKTNLLVKERPFDSNNDYQSYYHPVDIEFPKALSLNKTINIVFESIQTHASRPFPKSVGQNEEQALKYTTNLFILSPYATSVQRTKIKARSDVISYTTPKGIETFADEGLVSKSGATIVYGPYNNIPGSALDDFIHRYQQPVTVHYHHDQPVLEVLDLERSVEISHWGANLNTQDKIVLHNAGPALKGHFSRLEHQTQAFYKRPASHILTSLTLHPPTGIRNAYYYDLIGNVSTSKLRSPPSLPKDRQGTKHSILELKPRYPLMGGWNYSFTLGWDTPLEDTASYDKSTGRYIVEVPILTPIPGTVVNREVLSVIFPEGATDVQYAAPFPAVSNSTGNHVTYLDTAGRPVLTFQYKDLTIRHAETILVSYKVSTYAHLMKPIAVATAFFSVFMLCMFVRRVDLTLHQKKLKKL